MSGGIARRLQGKSPAQKLSPHGQSTAINPSRPGRPKNWTMIEPNRETFRGKRVLVTGGTGTLGPVLVKDLLDAGAVDTATMTDSGAGS